MSPKTKPRYEFRIFGNNLTETEEKINKLSKKEKTRKMTSVYLLASGNPGNNIKIRDGVMDIKVLENVKYGLEQWNPFLVGEFPLSSEVIRTVVFPSLGVQCPVLERDKYTLKQLVDELITVDPDLSVAYVNKTRHSYTINKCITEIAEITVNGAFIKTICVESEEPEKVLKVKNKLGIDDTVENVNYPLALKRIMGLVQLPEIWKSWDF